MKATVVRWHEARQHLALRWLELRRENPALESPYFHPKFTGLVNIRRRDTEIAVIEEPFGGPVAFLPFHRLPGNIAVPVGHHLSDYHGLICHPDYECDIRYVLRQCGLIAYNFNHLVPSRSFARYLRETNNSPQIDLSNGFDAYAKAQKAVKSEQIKIRRLERDHGPLRFVAQTTDQVVLNLLFALKNEQYRRTGAPNALTMPWTTDLLRDILTTNDRDFAGILSVLYAGDRIAAAHLGMRSRRIWHHWFPAYDRELATYSPGLILLLRMCEYAPTIGIKTIDLGKSMYEWKRRFMNASTPVASGSVERLSRHWFSRAVRQHAGVAARVLGLRRMLRVAAF
jgi:CelD/BcsL family acetyltransferase involved in cellulose biosynthesis